MRVLFLSPNREAGEMPVLPLGLACVAEAARAAGHEVRVLDLMGVEDAAAALRAAVPPFDPDVVGISIRNVDNQDRESPCFFLEELREWVSLVRELTRAPLVLGGAGFSIFQGRVLDYLEVDLGIQGDGEVAFPELLQRMERGEGLEGLPGLHVRGEGCRAPPCYPRDLDAFPLPGPDLFSLPGVRAPDLWFPVQVRRGCPMGCTYCATAAVEGRALRRRSPASVVRYLARWVAAGISRFYFVDALFNLPPSYALDLCREIAAAGLGVRWRAILYPGRLDSRLAAAMARAGCFEVALGFESGNPAVLTALNKRFTPEGIRETCRLLRVHGIRTMGFLLLGGPGETRDTVEESLAFTDALALDALKITVGIRIYPGTPLARIAAAQGIVPPGDDLLRPRFYLAPGLEGRLPDRVREWSAARPGRVVPPRGV